MTAPYVPRVGGTLSADIAVPEHERELRFYSRVLGTGQNPLWREDLMNNLGMPIIGLGERNEAYAHLPLLWMPHIQVADVATSAQRAVELGGTELMHGKDDEGQSQWAVLLDPNGAAFGIVAVVSAEDMPVAADPASSDMAAPMGCISWIDLTVSDVEETRDFYERVVGWSTQDTDDLHADCKFFGSDGNPAAAIRHAAGANRVPPVWMICLPVGDLAESLRRVREEGGEIIEETRGDDGECRYAVVQDPVGACLALEQG